MVVLQQILKLKITNDLKATFGDLMNKPNLNPGAESFGSMSQGSLMSRFTDPALKGQVL